MKRFASGALLLAGLTCMPASHAAFFDFGKKEEVPPLPSVLVVAAEDSIDFYVAKLVTTLKGEQAPLWDQNSDEAFIFILASWMKSRNSTITKPAWRRMQRKRSDWLISLGSAKAGSKNNEISSISGN